MKRLSFILTLISLQAVAAEPKSVKIDFIEALSPKDTTSSERFQKDFEGAISTSKSLLAPRLEKCGYTFETKVHFYEAGDPLKAKDISKSVEGDGSWLIVGPRRSNHYLLLVQGTERIPTISLMASTDQVATLPAQHLSLSPTNTQMAEVAAKEMLARKKSNYVTIVSDDCGNCVDFSKAFDQFAGKQGLKKLAELKVTGETIDTSAVQSFIKKHSPHAVMLPNYSKISGAVMAAFNDFPKKPLFVGGDGWGDNRYGFVQNGLAIDKISGITVRGFPPVDKALASFPLGKQIQANSNTESMSGSILGVTKIMDSIATLVCDGRPDSKEAFKSYFEKKAPTFLRAPWGVSVYSLVRGEITFEKMRSLAKRQ